jgi:methionyl-tRNA synthetase
LHPTPVVIIAPPPTPNGDLHVGHLSGPYFGADVLARYLRLRGTEAVTALSVDLNQSYVVTTAERLGTKAQALAHKSHAEVQSTLTLAGIDFDVVGMPDAAYSSYVRDWFMRLYTAGALTVRQHQVPYDTARNRFMFESYGSGNCPTCLASTKSNICEACGHPNEAVDLMGLYPTGGKPGDSYEMREVAEYVLELEPLRAALLDHLDRVIPERRPAMARLISELFAKPLPDFPVTFPSDWGIAAPFPNAEGLVLNVWAEMVPGHYYWIDAACGQRHRAPIVADQKPARYVQYLGFDNSFFYVVAHLALALAAKKAGIEAILPDAFVTNEFYLLDNFKFSTSQGHLIWGRDLLAIVPMDEVRFFLAWSNPEYNQANFTMEDMERVLQRKFREPMERLVAALADLPGSSVVASQQSEALLNRFASSYDERHQSLRIAALTVSNGFDLLSGLIAQQTDPAILRGIAQAIACGLSPISPNAANRLWAAAGGAASVAWPQPQSQPQRAEYAA